MVIKYKAGDILAEDAEALVNTVNCVGVMGRGIALQFKKAFPENYKAYAAACKREEVKPGRMFVYETGQLTNPRYIINFPTKRHWKGKSRLADINAGLESLVTEIELRQIQSIAIPPLGSGLGGLDWTEVKNSIEAELDSLGNVQVVVFKPEGSPGAGEMVRNKEVPEMTPARAVLIVLMRHYLAGLLDPFVTLLEIHKLMYFMEEAGEALQLGYQKASYGPYSEKLRHVLNPIEGHLINGYSDGGDSPSKPIHLVPGALEDAESFLEERAETRSRLGKVARLVEGFESSFGLELLASVHWIMKHEQASSFSEVRRLMHTWDRKKEKFSDRQIQLAMDVLQEQGWLASQQT